MSIFEMIMLVCFGAAWPVSIIKSWNSRTNNGKSLFFLIIVLAGYVAGILHKIFYLYDMVILLYFTNFTMITVDLLIYYRNSKLDKERNNG